MGSILLLKVDTRFALDLSSKVVDFDPDLRPLLLIDLVGLLIAQSLPLLHQLLDFQQSLVVLKGSLCEIY